MGPLSYLKSLFGVSGVSGGQKTEKLTPREATRLLTEEVTAGYRPTSPLANFYSGSAGTPSLARMLTDVEAMLAHPRVSTTLDYYKGGIAGAKFVLQDASSPEVGKFALAELETFWQRGRQAVQRSYEYGRGGCEIVYSRDSGAMRFASAHPVAPLDCRVLTRGSHYAGFRLRGSQPLGTIDLWGASGWMPAKGLWFAHNPRYSRWYGWPRLYAAWRPWKRLAGKDGAEEIVDGGVYRFAFAPPIGRYPAQDERVKGPDGSTSQWSNRDKMREMLEHMKAGGVVAFSSRRDESGSYVWDVDWPQGSLDVDGLLVYTDNLEKAISLGVGVPPELLEASEVGSGYSGRAIPLEVFYAGQQHNADALVEVWYRQVGEPILRFNFGPDAWARITVEDLLRSRMQNLQQSQNPPEQPPRPPGQPVQMSTFREEDHARANDGKFTSGGGSGSAAASESKSTLQRSQATAAYQERQKAREQKRQQIQSRRQKLDSVQPVASGPASSADAELLSRMGLFRADTPKEEIDRAASVSANLGASFATSATKAIEQITALTGTTPEKLQARLEKGQAAVARHTARLQKAHASIEPLREKYLATQAAIAELEGQAPPEPESDASDSTWEAYERVQSGFDAQLEKLEAKRDSAEERLTDAIDRLSDVSGDLAEAVDRAEEDFDDELVSVLDGIEESLDSADEQLDTEEADDEEPEDDEPDEPDSLDEVGEQATRFSTFREEDHSRDGGGKFASKGSGAGSGSSKPASKPAKQAVKQAGKQTVRQTGDASSTSSATGTPRQKVTAEIKRRAGQALRQARGAVEGLVLAGEKAKGASLSVAKKLGQKIWDRLSPKQQKTAEKAWKLGLAVEHRLQSLTVASHEIVAKVARERGLKDDQIARVERIVKTADLAMSWTANIPAVHHLLAVADVTGATGFLLSKVGYYVPVASLSYLVYSTARNPFATVKAAREVIRNRGQGATHLATAGDQDQQTIELLADAIRQADDRADWFHALLCAAIDEGLSLAEAIRAAQEAMRSEEPTDA